MEDKPLKSSGKSSKEPKTDDERFILENFKDFDYQARAVDLDNKALKEKAQAMEKERAEKEQGAEEVDKIDREGQPEPHEDSEAEEGSDA
jgi:hypothetical protein